MEGQFVTKAGYGGSVGDESKINLNGEALSADTEDLTNIVLHIIQSVDAGTVTLNVEYTLNGTNWAAIRAALAESDLIAGNGSVTVATLSDANGMPIPAKAVRIRASALASGGEYKLAVGGLRRAGFG